MHSAEGWPDAVSFDPGNGGASSAFEELLRDLATTPVLLLAVGPLAQRGGWAANAAIALADAIAAGGERVVLADLSLDRPELHERVGTENTEGLTDVFLFGASLEHVTRMLPANSFELVPAAAFTPDSEEILTHRRWSVVFEEFAATKTRLLLYLPITVDGTGAFSDRVGHTVVLADRWETEAIRGALSSDAHVMAFLAPPETPDISVAELPVPPEEDEPAPAQELMGGSERLDDAEFEKIRLPKEGAREALIADLRARQRAALMAPAPSVQPLPDEVDVARIRTAPPARLESISAAKTTINEPTFASTTREKRSRSRLIPLLIVLLLVSSAAATWHFWWRRRPVPEPRPMAQTPSTAPIQPRPIPQEPILPAGVPLRFSVAIAGYSVLEQAQTRVAQLRKESESMNFYIAPTVVQGSLFYRVLAGPLSDSVTASAVRDTLMARRIKTFTSSSDVLDTPYAFLVGSFSRRSEADAKVAEATSKGIPTYVIPAGMPGGAVVYKVFAGAYTGPGDAAFLREILERASLPDTLVERTGSIRS
jgi:cell division septation protein DedD